MPVSALSILAQYRPSWAEKLALMLWAGWQWEIRYVRFPRNQQWFRAWA
jgi:hypothetical protein